MSYLDFKKRALMRIINSVKGFIRTITGVNSVTLDNCVDDDSLINLSIYGNSVQDGTPAPDSPVEIQSVGELVTDESDEHYGKYKIPIKAKGKNLFNVNNYLSDRNQPVIVFDCSNLNVGTKYTLSSDKPLSWFKISTHASGYNSVQKTGEIYSFTFTMARHSNISESETQYIIIGISGVSAISDISELDGYNIQIEEGSEATDYEAYHEQKTFNIWANEPLRKVGEYADELDVERGIITRNACEYTCTGTESLSCGTDDKENVYRYYLNKSMLPNKTVATSGFCTHLKNNRSILIDDRQVVFGTRNAQIYFYLYKETYPDVATVKEWLLNQYENDTPIKVVYPARDLVEEIIEVPEIPTFKGTTIYEINTTIPSSAVEAEYYSSVSDE